MSIAESIITVLASIAESIITVLALVAFWVIFLELCGRIFDRISPPPRSRKDTNRKDSDS